MKSAMMPALAIWSRAHHGSPLLVTALLFSSVPVAAYSLMLTATAVTSAWSGGRSAAGGALFLASDSLIGARLAAGTSAA
ncbi:hypothetical protein ACQPXM_37070 [Kribbella sp. CA-253562]|uniref:hypothetical protein n=1 Tax=Kribbella sp. CA-253562 TaxID=3239942 RepID=UPI003D91D0E4